MKRCVAEREAGGTWFVPMRRAPVRGCRQKAEGG